MSLLSHFRLFVILISLLMHCTLFIPLSSCIFIYFVSASSHISQSESTGMMKSFHMSIFFLSLRAFLSICIINAIDSNMPSESVYKCIGILYLYSPNISVYICHAVKTASSTNLFNFKVSTYSFNFLCFLVYWTFL